MRRLFPLMVVIVLPLAACGGGNQTDGPGPAKATVQVLPDSVNVGKYDPTPVTVPVGDAIRWEWKDTANPHSVTADDNSFDSNLLDNGKSWTRKFTKAGTFKYHCSIHPQMLGTVIVQ